MSVLHKSFKQMTSKILKIRSLEVVAVCGTMSRSQEDAAFLACAFVNIPGAHPLWTSLRHKRSMSITILRDSHFEAFLTWRMMRQQTPINEKKCLPACKHRSVVRFKMTRGDGFGEEETSSTSLLLSSRSMCQKHASVQF